MGNDDKIIIIPRGFRLIAKTDHPSTSVSVYLNKDRHSFIILVNDEKLYGPVSLDELKTLHHVVNDVIEMKTNYFFLE